jgi:hypothetical protein
MLALRSQLALAGAAAMTFLTIAPAAHAYPQWQFSSGTSRCNQCHFSPAGGGLLTGYGRDAVGEDVSTWQGNGGVLHGAVDLPAWLALGLDARGAALHHQAGNPRSPWSVFPMQADLQARVAFTDAFSLQATAGYRGRARSADEPLADDNYHPGAASAFISREHFLMWRPAALGVYVRAGRFAAPYGLRLAEHTTYVRRDLGFNLLEEGYAVSGGTVQNDWELHLTAFGPDFLRQTGNREAGGAALFETRLIDRVALGADARAGFAHGAGRTQAGIFGKGYFAPLRTMLMSELDLVHHTVSNFAATEQFVGLAGLTVFPVRGLWLTAFLERNQTAVSVRDSATNAIDGQINWFPAPHFELVALGRAQKPSGQRAAQTLLFQLHYFL